MEARYQVFVSSTYEDLKEERKEAVQAILEMDCFPAGMELFPASDKKQWDIIKKVIDDSDFYLLVLGGRYGSLGKDDRGMPVGYTEMEFDYAIRENKPVFAFIHEKPDTLPAARVERTEDGIARLNQFREKIKSNGTVMFWSNKDDLKASILKTLNDKRKEIRDEEGKTEGWIRYEQRFGWIRERKPVKEFIEKAEKSIFITGNSLNSLYDSPTLLHELLSRGLEVKLILLSNEGLKKNCIQLGAGYDKMKSMIRITQRRKVKDFFIKSKKKSHFADFLTEQTLDFVLHCLFCGLAEMHTDDISCLADLLSDSRASGGVGCGIVHSKSSCK
ncbi:hypothetical protein CLS_33040 [[Clostridium] cf. saccharolyticum K10]|nr:hypothetical protein CLS_33040 [[Clostridium] cf. saccharolyticum K10]